MILICFLLLFWFAKAIPDDPATLRPFRQGYGVFDLKDCDDEMKFENENNFKDKGMKLQPIPRCICNEKYYLGSCEKRCENDFCNSNGDASVVNNECTCKCKNDYGGPKCNETKCKADTIIDSRLTLICHPEGTKSVVEKGECKCNCKEGWFGKLCENHKELICEKQCSKEGTSKIDLIDDQCICHCKPGYFGRKLLSYQQTYEDCSFVCDISSSATYCNAIGTKTDEWEGGVCFCRCQKDYFGPRCESRCVGWGNSGCDKGGTESSYIEGDKCKCKCKQGYYGETCGYECNNYNGNGVCLAEGTESAEIIDDKCKCNCKKGFYGEKCIKCSDYCGEHSSSTEEKDGMCKCKCKDKYHGEACNINCDEECGVSSHRKRATAAKWESGKCVCTCDEQGSDKYFTPMCTIMCNKEGAKDGVSECKWEVQCKDRFAGKKCQIDKYTGNSETGQNETGHNETESTGHIMGITVAVLIIIIGAWI